MSDRINVHGLQVEPVLYDFINNEALPGSGVDQEAFWSGAAEVINDLAYGLPPVPAVLMGVITGCIGGVIRDVLAGRPSILMRPELYVTAAALSASLCALGEVLSLPREIAFSAAALAGFVLRGWALHSGLALPAYGRDPD